MRRALRIGVRLLAAMAALAVLMTLTLVVLGNTERGRLLITTMVARLSADRVRLTGLSGVFPAHLALDRLQIADAGGPWLEARNLRLDWLPLSLFERRIIIERLSVASLTIERAPLGERSTGPAPSIPRIDLQQGGIDVLTLGAPLVGHVATLRVRGSARLRSLEDASTELEATRTDGEGLYRLTLHFDPHALEAELAAHEPASGPLEHLLTVPGLGALDLQAHLAGPRQAVRLVGSLSAGAMRAAAQGTIDLDHASGQIEASLQAPALAPRPDLQWRELTLALQMHGTLTAPSGEGHLEIAGLSYAGSTLESATARIEGSAGELTARAQLLGIALPGPQPRLLGSAPLELTAHARLGAPQRPLDLEMHHPLFDLDAHALTAAPAKVRFALELHDLAPLAQLAGERLAGQARLDGQIEQRAGALGMQLEGSAAQLESPRPWTAALEHRLALALSGELSMQRFKLERLRLSAPAFDLSLVGEAQRAPGAPAVGSTPAALIGSLQARWTLDLGHLERFSSNLGGDLHGSGRIEGAPRQLEASGELATHLSIHGSPPGAVRLEFTARGLPRAPSGSVRAQGTLDGAPLVIDAALEPARRGLHALVRRADWKSAHAQGELWIDRQAAVADRGTMQASVGDLADFDRVLGAALAGRLEARLAFTPGTPKPRALLDLEAHALHAGGFDGDVRLHGAGPIDAVALDVGLQAGALAGAPAALSARTHLDLQAQTLHLDTAELRYRQALVTLQSPAVVRFGDGIAVSGLVLGSGATLLNVDGTLAPALDVHARLSGVDPALINHLVPDLLASGKLAAQLDLRGSFGAPEGSMHVEAEGVKLADADAAGLPAVDGRAQLDIERDRAQLRGNVSAHGERLLEVAGTVPLLADVPYDLKGRGKLDFGLVNAVLEARGLHATGALDVDVRLEGTRAAPQIHGTLALAHGSLRDYVRGVSLTDISAQVVGNDSRLQIERFKAAAASGSVTLSGSLSPLEQGIPIALEVTASRAQPIASNLLTVTLDSKLALTGKLLERVDLTGTVHIDRAIIGIPDTLPPEVAVLDVHRRGRTPAPAPASPVIYRFDVTVDAPNQVLVQGRGLDAELGGRLQLRGTAERPIVSGSFELQRGSFAIGGSTLTLKPPGQVSFDDAGLRHKIDPTLDFTASSTVADVGTSVTATVHITGYADAPKFEISSQPERPPDEIMALLLFGQPPGQLSALQLAQIGAALATLTGVGGGAPNPLVKLQRSLGLDRLTVGSNTTTTATGATESSGAAIAAGRYISSRVYVEGRQTTSGESQVQVDVDLTKHLKLQTRLGNGTAVTQGTTPENDPGSSVGLSYQFEY